MIHSPKRQAGTSTTHMPKVLHGKTLFFWRGIWIVTVLLNVGILVYCIPGFIVQQATVCRDTTLVTCGSYQLHPAQLALLARLHLSLNGYAAYVITLDTLTTLALLVIGALIFWRKSNDGMGLFVSLLLITFGCFGVEDVHVSVISQSSPLPIEIFMYLVLFFQWPALGFFFYLYPNGRFVPRWSWLLGSLFVINLVFYLLPSPYDLSDWPPVAQLLATLIVFGNAVGTQVYRYFAVATPLQRQQIKWLVFGFSTTLLIALLTLIPPLLFPDLNAATSWYQAAWIFLSPMNLFLGYFIIPLSIGISLLRYRLWDIDVLINRALVYGLLTGILLLLYIGLIFGGQALLVSFLGKNNNNPVVLVISTLVVVALFRPLRHRLQTLIDRRFYRYKYDAAQTVASFSKTLQQEVDLQHLQEQLVQVVAETMQPTHVSLWLRQERKPK